MDKSTARFLLRVINPMVEALKESGGVRDKIGVRGCVKWEVWRGDVLLTTGENHNIVTDEGDALIADLCAETPAKTKVDNTNGFIEVGTGFSAEAKGVLSCVTPTGSPEAMDATYPVLKGAFGAADDNVIIYKSTFEAGDLNDTGIDEAALMNNAVAASGDCLAYAEITPVVNVTTADSLVITWEISFLGA